MQREEEASVEEILESIKRVIARDNRETAELVRKKRVDDGVVHSAKPVEDVLELEAAAEFFEEVDDSALDEASEGPLIGTGAARSISDSLAALAIMAEPGAAPQIVRSGETSLEGMTREMLRPMLAEWLDKNLPPIVEKMVAAEIARIAGKKG